MKVMLAVDGSIFSASAISDLPRAGLPGDAQLRVVSVADNMDPPPLSDFDLVSMATSRVDAVLSREQAYREVLLSDAARVAAEAADDLRTRLPEMKIDHEVLQGKPEDELLRAAWQWEPDLVVTGSHGYSTIKRFLVGSVSSVLAERAETSVRIVPRRFDEVESGPAKLLIGVRGTMDAEHILDALNDRVWPDGARIRLMVVNEFEHSGEDPTADELAQYHRIAKPVESASTHVSIDIRTGNPETLLLAEADSWAADAIFISAPTLGRHASGLAAGNICPVEVVR
jgi:nucleotide-binding universal stress UspA family protein